MSRKIYSRDDERAGMDKFLRSLLEDYPKEPTVRTWRRLNRKLFFADLFRLNVSAISRTRWMILASLILITAGISIITISTGRISPSEKSSLSSGRPATTNITIHQTDPSIPSSNKSTYEEFQPAIDKHPITTGNHSRQEQPINIHISANPVIPEYKSFDSREESTISGLDPVQILSIPHDNPDTFTIRHGNKIDHFNFSKPPVPRVFTATLNCSPEYLVNGQSSQSGHEFYSWLNSGFTYTYARFSLTAGVGLGFLWQDEKYRIEYKSRDSVGFFYRVTGGHIITTGSAEGAATWQIVYDTVRETVYDTITHLADDQSRNRYTYLQIPVLLGYRLFESNRFCLNIQAGPAVTFLIGKKEALPEIQYPNTVLYKINRSVPDRASTTWQMWLKISMEYRITKMLGIAIEPYFKYYLDPVTRTEGKSAGMTWSLGINLGLNLNFGKKQQP